MEHIKDLQKELRTLFLREFIRTVVEKRSFSENSFQSSQQAGLETKEVSPPSEEYSSIPLPLGNQEIGSPSELSSKNEFHPKSLPMNFSASHISRNQIPARPSIKPKITSSPPNAIVPVPSGRKSRQPGSGDLAVPVPIGFSQDPHPQISGIPRIPPIPGIPDMGKLNIVLKDPSVTSIECAGPEKNILVKKGHSTQSTGISLQEEEIQEIIGEFSTKTKIPQIGGLFKSALANMIVSSVSSEFLGTRFIIQRKNPYLPLLARS